MNAGTMKLEQLNIIISIITLIGLLVNIWISRQAMKTAKSTEKYKVSSGFREKALDHLRDGRRRISTRIDLIAVMKSLDRGNVLPLVTNLREDYILSGDMYIEFRYLFTEERRTSIDKLRKNADQCDMKCRENISEAVASGKNHLPLDLAVPVSAFLEAAASFKSRLIDDIDEMMIHEASALRIIY
ncbi:MAG: hypothetical protein NTW38_10875 [Candidatus Aminicenantes bacterium]|nr:hypothetical protein [Candidatus Aminicenantes bacterium]